MIKLDLSVVKPVVFGTVVKGPDAPASFRPGIIAPGQKWSGEYKYSPEGDFDGVRVLWPRISIIQLAITDAAGRRWDVRPSRGRPPRRVRWWREWPWRRGLLRLSG
jgi:hypothetical protein